MCAPRAWLCTGWARCCRGARRPGCTLAAALVVLAQLAGFVLLGAEAAAAREEAERLHRPPDHVGGLPRPGDAAPQAAGDTTPGFEPLAARADDAGRTGTGDARTMGLPRSAVRRYPCAAVRAFAPCRGGHAAGCPLGRPRNCGRALVAVRCRVETPPVNADAFSRGVLRA